MIIHISFKYENYFRKVNHESFPKKKAIPHLDSVRVKKKFYKLFKRSRWWEKVSVVISAIFYQIVDFGHSLSKNLALLLDAATLLPSKQLFAKTSVPKTLTVAPFH